MEVAGLADRQVEIHEATVAGLGVAWRVRSCGALSNVTRSGSVAWMAILAAVGGVPAADARSTGPAGRGPRRWRWPAWRTGGSRSTTMEVAGLALPIATYAPGGSHRGEWPTARSALSSAVHPARID